MCLLFECAYLHEAGCCRTTNLHARQYKKYLQTNGAFICSVILDLSARGCGHMTYRFVGQAHTQGGSVESPFYLSHAYLLQLAAFIQALGDVRFSPRAGYELCNPSHLRLHGNVNTDVHCILPALRGSSTGDPCASSGPGFC